MAAFVIAAIVFIAICYRAFSKNKDIAAPSLESTAAVPQPVPVVRPAPAKAPAVKSAASAPMLEVNDPVNRRKSTVTVTHSPFNIGRHSQNDLHLVGDDHVSRWHMQLVEDMGKWYAMDCGSVIGVILNGRLVSGDLIVHGDRLEVGPFQLTFIETDYTLDSGIPVSQGEQYESIKEIGHGGMATVYTAIRSSNGEIVVLKTPEVDRYEDQEMIIERFKREATICQQLKHPNIVNVFGNGVFSDGHPYISMEYLPGGTLREKIRSGKPMAEQDSRRIGGQVASALHYAHSAKITHRDVKPENILFDAGGSAKLTDFGIAWMKGCKQMTQLGTKLGTVHYMSPEQTRGGEVTSASDVYSLGIMLYEMNAGKRPFEGVPEVIMDCHRNQAPAPLNTHNAQVSKKMETLVSEMLEKDPRNRPQCAELVSKRLQTLN